MTAARDLLRITQVELADAAEVSYRSVLKFESGEAELRPSTLQKILAELERRGIEFTNGTGIGVRLNFEKAAQYSRSVAQTRNEADR